MIYLRFYNWREEHIERQWFSSNVAKYHCLFNVFDMWGWKQWKDNDFWYVGCGRPKIIEKPRRPPDWRPLTSEWGFCIGSVYKQEHALHIRVLSVSYTTLCIVFNRKGKAPFRLEASYFCISLMHWFCIQTRAWPPDSRPFCLTYIFCNYKNRRGALSDWRPLTSV